MEKQTISRRIEILLVEDIPGDVRVFRENLAEAGNKHFILTCVRTLNEAIIRLEGKQYDVVIMDLTLPDSQGVASFDNIHRHAPQVPVILLTGINDEDLAVSTLQNGAQDYLVKGHVDGRSLIRSIRYAIERNQVREKESRLAYFDALTCLPNRRLFYDRLNQALSHAQRYKQKVALVCIDLDGFKLVNDSFGHHVGDLLLQEVARRLEECLRKSDTVARVGGDEFTCILPNIQISSDVTVVAQKIIRALNRPFDLNGRRICISGSIGASLFPDHSTDADQLMKNADVAMYNAKNQGKNNFQFFIRRVNFKKSGRREASGKSGKTAVLAI